MSGRYIYDLSLSEYLADRERSSGSSLRLARIPELYKRWLEGHDVGGETEATGRGSWFHARLTEGASAADRFAFLPSRADVVVPQWERTKSGKSHRVKDGEKVPILGADGEQLTMAQDSSPGAEHKSMLVGDDFAKAYKAHFLASNTGKTIVTPESQHMVEPMLRATMAHPDARRLLEDPGFRPEVTAHWTCPVTHEPLKYRWDGLIIRPNEEYDIGIEVKTYQPRGDDRLDTTDPWLTMKWARAGWPHKSSLGHCCHRTITGRGVLIRWIIVEARVHGPRVSVVPDDPDSTIARLGRDGDPSWRLVGHLGLARLAQDLRRSDDFTHHCTRGMTRGFVFPDALEGDGLTGATEVD